MKIKKVAVLGAGAVGSYVIWGLSSRNDIELGVIASGQLKNCSRIPESISGRQSMQEKRCGASFG